MAKNGPADRRPETARGIGRRSFLGASATAALASPVAAAIGQSTFPEPVARKGTCAVTLDVNGESHRLTLDVRTSLLDALRDHIGLTGAKKGCDHGQCGACTVLVDGKRQLSCLDFAVMAETREIVTIEGLAKQGGALHPMQQAFIDNDAFQCGYCTPGQILSAIACVREKHAESEDDIREYMSGNLCRCAAYPNIVAAIRQAHDETRGSI